jgi:hypothetical protein
MARELAQQGGPPGWLEESDPAGIVHDGRGAAPLQADGIPAAVI